MRAPPTQGSKAFIHYKSQSSQAMMKREMVRIFETALYFCALSFKDTVERVFVQLSLATCKTQCP